MRIATLAITAVRHWVTHSVCHSVCNTLWHDWTVRDSADQTLLHHLTWNIFTIEKYFWNIFQLKTIKTHFYSQLEDFQPCLKTFGKIQGFQKRKHCQNRRSVLGSVLKRIPKLYYIIIFEDLFYDQRTRNYLVHTTNYNLR